MIADNAMDTHEKYETSKTDYTLQPKLTEKGNITPCTIRFIERTF